MRRPRLVLAAIFAGALPGSGACSGTLELDPIAGQWRLDAVTGSDCTATDGSLTIDSDLSGGEFRWTADCAGTEQGEVADVIVAEPQAGQGQYTVDLRLRQGDLPLRWDCTVTENTQTMDCEEVIGGDPKIFEFSRP